MPKKVRIVGTSIGGDISTLDLYHTSITASNLITSSISASVMTGSGFIAEVPDSATIFYAYVSGGLCLGTTSSVTASAYSPATRYFTVYTSGSDEGSTVEMISPFSIGPTETSFTASFNTAVYSSATLQANQATYPDDQFVGWYYSSTSSAAFFTGSTLTLTSGSYTGSNNFYAFFRDS